MRLAVTALVVAAAGIGTARFAREAAKETAPEQTAAPFAPSPSAAPFLSLGYREVAADLFYVRLIGYFAVTPEPDAGAALAEAIIALDPKFRPAYEFGALALTDARYPNDQARELRAIAILEKGMREFPSYYRFPDLAGKIYIGDLQTTDEAQRREWDEKGAALLEIASRKPGAPADSAMMAATLQTRVGQQQRAIENLEELLLLTEDPSARAKLIAQLAKIANQSSDEIAAEMLDARHRFDDAWKRERPAVTPSMYLQIGPPLPKAFDMGDLATGGRDLIGSEGFEKLEPLTD